VVRLAPRGLAANSPVAFRHAAKTLQKFLRNLISLLVLQKHKLFPINQPPQTIVCQLGLLLMKVS
jgi:hypothetical protein